MAFFYYENEKRLFTDLTKSNLQNIVSKASNEVILSHMRELTFDKEKYVKNKTYEISFYDKNQFKLFGTFDDNVDFSKQTLFSKKSLILVDKSTVGHLGIEYIVIKDTTLGEKLQALQLNIILFFFLIYLIIFAMGFYLAKLFLQPIKDEREKLNNFIKDTTHELNTPISAILMSIEKNDLTQKQLQRIRMSVNRISEVYKDLTYIFLQNSDAKKTMLSYRLDELIREQLDFFDPLLCKKKITTSVKLEPFSYTMNRDDFIRLFNNLFSNAIKYNHFNGNIEVILKKNELILSDNGMGIEKRRVNDIFNRYVRATSNQGGFGIGLNIVKHICEEYDITVSVESELNVGTTFRLQF